MGRGGARLSGAVMIGWRSGRRAVGNCSVGIQCRPVCRSPSVCKAWAGVELRRGRLCVRVLMWESRGLSVVILVVLAEG